MALSFFTRTARSFRCDRVTVANPVAIVVTFLLLHALLYSTAAETTPLFARSGGILQVLVPVRPAFKEIVDCSPATGSSSVSPSGFCIDVFKNALSILIPKPNWTDINYNCFPIGNGNNTYDTMINYAMSHEGPQHYDAVVGDITISAARLENASFTQSFLESGIVIVAPAGAVSQHFPGVFFAPFTIQTWTVVIVSVLITGVALWLLECNEHPHFQATQSRLEQFKKVFWFVTSILVFFKRESIKSPLAKFVMMAWILYVLLLGSSYTASLSSILTVNELSSEALTIDDLYRNNFSVGFQLGSIVGDYLTGHRITNLIAMNNSDQYAAALRNKRVVAVVDEIPYISLFLAAQSAANCSFAVGPKLTIEGLGFAFRDKNLSAAFSVAILNLSESGQMKRLQDGWKLNNFQCPSQIQATQLDLKSSEGLFLLLGSGMFLCIVIFVLRQLKFPCGLRTYANMRENGRQDAIWEEPNFNGSLRRWFSARHHLSSEELVPI